MGKGYRSGPDVPGNPLFHQYICVEKNGVISCGGQTTQGGKIYGPGSPSNDTFNPANCEEISINQCINDCLLRKFGDSRPYYGTNGLAITSFQEGLIQNDYNELNQILSATNPQRTFIHDDDGNMIVGYTPDGYEFAAQYDAENRLKQIEYTDDQGKVHKREYIYRGDWLLAQIKKYEDDVMIEDIRMVRDGFLVLQERDASNTVIRQYNWGQNMGGGIGGLLSLSQDDQDYSYLYDGKGNVTSVIDSSQNPVATYAYDPFGKLMMQAGNFNQPFQFSTKRYDVGTGLSYFGYRYYSAAIGRWITRDPIEERGGLNLYGFVSNNPNIKIDSVGLACALIDHQMAYSFSESEEKIFGNWIYSHFQQINIACLCIFTRDIRIDVTEIHEYQHFLTYKCTKKEECGGEKTYYKYKTYGYEYVDEYSRYGGREYRKELRPMTGAGEGVESGNDCLCRPFFPLPPPGWYQN